MIPIALARNKAASAMPNLSGCDATHRLRPSGIGNSRLLRTGAPRCLNLTHSNYNFSDKDSSIEHSLAVAASDTVKVAKFVENSVLPVLKSAQANQSTIEAVTGLVSPQAANIEARAMPNQVQSQCQQ